MSLKRSNNLIDQHLSGKSAEYLIDGVLDHLPDVQEVKSSFIRDLPGAKLRCTEQEITISSSGLDRQELIETVNFYELAYPEIHFVIEKMGDKKNV